MFEMTALYSCCHSQHMRGIFPRVFSSYEASVSSLFTSWWDRILFCQSATSKIAISENWRRLREFRTVQSMQRFFISNSPLRDRSASAMNNPNLRVLRDE
jgi:hypothetical protein